MTRKIGSGCEKLNLMWKGMKNVSEANVIQNSKNTIFTIFSDIQTRNRADSVFFRAPLKPCRAGFWDLKFLK